MWTCKKCGRTISGKVVEPVHCPCKIGEPEPEILEAIPYDDWPLWARTVAALKTDTDAGVGDTFERIAASMGGVAFKAWAKAAGIDCGCDARKASWNVLYPYG